MNKAIFLDRDGTLIYDKGYIKDINKLKFYSGVFSSLIKLQQHYKLFIVTNQAGIAKGITTVKEVNTVNNFILKKFKTEGVNIEEIYTCPHQKDDNCECIKPKPYFINIAKEKYNLELQKSFVIGDHQSDVELAINTGAKGIYVMTGHGRSHLVFMDSEIRKKIKICGNINLAANYILRNF
jgi:D-glycero-D-manno-heptose 1,7-bisphosphate phosphatase